MVNDDKVAAPLRGTSGRDFHLSGDGPDEGCHFPRDGDHDLVDLLAPGDQPAVTFAEAHLRFPTTILDDLGHVL